MSGARPPAVPSAEMAAVLARLERHRNDQPNRYALPFEEARAQLVEERQWWRAEAPVMASSDEQRLSFSGRSVRIRRETPAESASAIEIVYLHGGGWCVGSIDTHDAIIRGLAAACGCPVTGVDYSLAPEFPYPSALDDLRQVFAWLRARAPRTTRWILAGDSAGANLALLESMRARDAGEPGPDGLVLYYGVYLPVRPTASMRAYGDGRFGLSREAQLRYENAYLAGVTPDRVPGAFPLFGSLRNLPPMLLVAAELDPLLDDSHRLLTAVQDFGGQAELIVYPGVIHGFLTYARMMQAPLSAFEDTAAFVRNLMSSAHDNDAALEARRRQGLLPNPA